jgi:hypothetical protein
MNTPTVTVIVERGSDNKFSAYMDCYDFDFGLAGFGHTAKEAIDDFYAAYEQEKTLRRKEGKDCPALAFDIRYDVEALPPPAF